MITHELLNRLWDSTLSLFDRFDVKQTPEQALANVLEEMREFLLATTDDNRAEEAADVIVTLMAWALPQNWFDNVWLRAFMTEISRNETKKTSYLTTVNTLGAWNWGDTFRYIIPHTTAEHIERVIRKNDTKTSKTHYVNADGKIARRPTNGLNVNMEALPDAE